MSCGCGGNNKIPERKRRKSFRLDPQDVPEKSTTAEFETAADPLELEIGYGPGKKQPSAQVQMVNQENPDMNAVDPKSDMKIDKDKVDENIRKGKHIKPENNKGVIGNLLSAAKSQNNKIKWFKDGVSGIIKCLKEDVLYTDLDIQKERDVCRDCEYSTKDKNGRLTQTSQCMGIDPNTGASCGCFILCKTQAGTCPLEKWKTTPITINNL